jgi:3-keto steroid reductase
LTDWRHSVTWPTFKGSSLGRLAKPQTTTNGGVQKRRTDEEPALGEVFCANVFGHYLLAHYLAPLLARSHHGHGRIVWLSSLEAYAHSFKLEDFQGLTHDLSYESSKRLTDTLVLTANLPSTSTYVHDYLSDANGVTKSILTTRRSDPKLYVCHPGICATGIFPLPYILALCMEAAFYVARWLGSVWHTCTAYKGATAPVWLALSDQTILDTSEQQSGKQKLGSSTNFWGSERVEWTEVEGWGYGGIERQTPSTRTGRWRHAKDMKASDKTEFERLGGLCWQEMERLRKEWEYRLEGVVNGV